MKTFLHSGDTGDIIYALPTIRALGGGVLYLRHGQTTVREFTLQLAQTLLPLLEIQPYLHSVQIWQNELIDVKLDNFRLWAGGQNWHINLADRHLLSFGLDLSAKDEPWLSVDTPEPLPQGKSVVFHRSSRYRNRYFDWKLLYAKHGAVAVFVGVAEEHAAFEKEVGKIPFLEPGNFLTLARRIAGASMFCGNQSSPYAIAEAMHHPRTVLEVCVSGPNCLFYRDGAEHYAVYPPPHSA